MNRKKRKQQALKNKQRSSSHSTPMKKVTQGLIFSGALNIALATCLIYYATRPKESQPFSREPYQPKVVAQMSSLSASSDLAQLVEDYRHLDFESLVRLLKDSREVHTGLSQRELALATLVSQYDFDLNRALSGEHYQIEPLVYGPGLQDRLALHRGLEDSAYKHILSFLKVEQWPFTAEGLFKKLASGVKEDSLKKAFFLTKEYVYFEALFSSLDLKKDELLELILEGSWEHLSHFAASQPTASDFNLKTRMRILCQYLDHASTKAAELILRLDANYALQTLSDEKVVALMGLLEHRTPTNENFVLNLALGKRSGWVKQEACRLIFYYAQREFKEPFNYQEALDFIAQEYDLSPQSTFSQSIPTRNETESLVSSSFTQTEKNQTYVVQKGDCLSKIAKMHGVDVSALKRVNDLNEDLIQVGMRLIIP